VLPARSEGCEGARRIRLDHHTGPTGQRRAAQRGSRLGAAPEPADVAMRLAKPITEFDTVKTWGEGLRKQWGGDPLAEEPEMVQALVEFCEFVGEDPDSIVVKLFRIRKADGERVLSVKWRRHYADKV